MGKELTPKQELFAQHYALCANGTRAAKLAGCPEQSAHVMASRWLSKVKIRLRVEELRDEYFAELKHMITGRLYASIDVGIRTGLGESHVRRASALLNRLGIWRYAAQLRELRLTAMSQEQFLAETESRLEAEQAKWIAAEENLRNQRRRQRTAKREQETKLTRLYTSETGIGGAGVGKG